MKVTEHYGNFDPDWSLEEIEELIRLIRKELNDVTLPKADQLFYGKMIGKLYGEKMKYTSDD